MVGFLYNKVNINFYNINKDNSDIKLKTILNEIKRRIYNIVDVPVLIDYAPKINMYTLSILYNGLNNVSFYMIGVENNDIIITIPDLLKKTSENFITFNLENNIKLTTDLLLKNIETEFSLTNSIKFKEKMK